MLASKNLVSMVFIVLIAFCGILEKDCWSADGLALRLRYQQPTSENSERFHRLFQDESWQPRDVAVIICDVWDLHHSVNAVRRVHELAPRINQFVEYLRGEGATIIHAPSDCMDAYRNHPARQRSMAIPAANDYPPEMDSWCHRIPSEERAVYPLDQSDGGEDDDLDELMAWGRQLESMGRKPRAPWLRQTDLIRIDPDLDFIGDSGKEIWNILQSRGISKVMLVGVHTNMCILGRPFGLRRLKLAGKNVVLVRDLTDTMYDSRDWPHANHFTGTDLIVSHIERYVCPTISSSEVLGGDEFRFSKDHRPQLAMLIAEDEYRTEETLPHFAAKHLSQSFRVTISYGSDTDRHSIVSIQDVLSADALLISVRRRWLPEHEMEWVRQFARSGRPMIGIRTASHAFSARSENPPAGLAAWPELDAEAWGGNYTGHFGNQLEASLSIGTGGVEHPILQSLNGQLDIRPGGSLYKTSPVAPGSTVLLMGQVAESPAEPVAWTFVRADGGRSFYTSLGHVDDFAQPQFETLLSAGIHWACQLPLPDRVSVEQQNARYQAGSEGQR